MDGGINTYAYVGGSPINAYDPNGQTAVWAFRAGWAAGSLADAAITATLGMSLGAYIYDATHQNMNMANAMMSQAGDTSKKSPEEAALNKAKNKACKSPDPKTGNPCADAKARLNRLQQCLSLRIEYRDKYGDAHPEEIANTTTAVANAEKAVEEACKDDCKK